ncbi:hypothetical protein Bbelb_342520 [Branchiostoma belcheri]|nr:hypothetical protein Bbelb_342520 [Branchiostoma belcheri]
MVTIMTTMKRSRNMDLRIMIMNMEIMTMNRKMTMNMKITTMEIMTMNMKITTMEIMTMNMEIMNMMIMTLTMETMNMMIMTMNIGIMNMKIMTMNMESKTMETMNMMIMTMNMGTLNMKIMNMMIMTMMMEIMNTEITIMITIIINPMTMEKMTMMTICMTTTMKTMIIMTMSQCLSAAEILVEYNIPPGMKVMTMPDFMNICPLLITQIDEQACMVHEEDSHDHSEHDEHKGTEMPAAVWGYGILAVTVISLLAVLGIVLLPFMEQRVYQFLLCFLVALAVGTLTGDAVLHLLPHALGLHAHADEDGHEGHEGHDEGHGDKGGHLDPVLKGLTVLFGIYFLFIMEKLMGVMTKRRAKRKAKKLRKQKELAHPAESYELKVATDSPIEDDHCHHHHHHHHHDNEKLKDAGIATMAWMVIMGDGLHNFSDGLAIGAAFASGIPGGVSTSIAVFCHELPHELGDFALLIRAGMSVKQAILYNLMSACICYIGLLIGLGIGKLSGNVIQYVFAVTAGMFLYVGLVDMLPDMVHPNQPQVIAEHDHGEHGHGHSHGQNDFSLDNNHGKRKKKQEPVNPVLVQTFGLLVGIGIMLLIAVYEDKIKI